MMRCVCCVFPFLLGLLLLFISSFIIGNSFDIQLFEQSSPCNSTKFECESPKSVGSVVRPMTRYISTASYQLWANKNKKNIIFFHIYINKTRRIKRNKITPHITSPELPCTLNHSSVFSIMNKFVNSLIGWSVTNETKCKINVFIFIRGSGRVQSTEMAQWNCIRAVHARSHIETP